MSLKQLSPKSHSQEDHWIPLSDVMTGLMMVFMLVAIVFMIQVQREAKNAKIRAEEVAKIAHVYQNMRAQLYEDLYSEFKGDLPVWRAVLSRDLSLRFEEPNVQFDTGQSIIKPGFAEILKSFFPRYLKIFMSKKYKDEIEEVRIEGHTSSFWKGRTDEDAYYENMKLSQERTRAVLQYVFSLNESRNIWLLDHVTADGLSSSKPILVDGKEDTKASQRVEFRVKTKSGERLDKILKALSQ